MRRPAPATVISLVALFFAMSGTAMAATGGDFILGESNTAKATSSLTNTKGSALSLTSNSTSPPLEVSNSVQIPNLNASELGGTPASGFLAVNGTAANSNELGGTPASGFVQGDGNISDGRLALSNGQSAAVVSAPGNYILAFCYNIANSAPGDSVVLYDPVVGSNELATWWNQGGVGQATLAGAGDYVDLDGTSPTTAVIVVQVDTGTDLATYTLTESYNSTAETCTYTGQVTNSNG